MQVDETRILVLASSFYTAALEKPFEQAIAKCGLGYRVVCLPYNQLHTFLLDPRSLLPENTTISALLLLRVEDFIRLELASRGKSAIDGENSCLQVFRERENQFCEVVSRILGLRMTVMICPAGRGAFDTSFLSHAIRIAEFKIVANFRRQQRHLVVGWSEFEQVTSPGRLFNRAGDRLGHVPFTPEGLNVLADFFTGQFDRMPTSRLESRSSSADALGLQHFLAMLEVEMSLTRATEEDEQAAINLIRHTTHFINLAGKKWDVGSLRAIADTLSNAETWIVRVRDKFGDYGIAGAAVFGIDAGKMYVEFLFLTCPVLGRQVEYALLEWMAQIARQQQATLLEVPFVQGQDNQVLGSLLAQLSRRFPTRFFRLPIGEEKRFLLPVSELSARILKGAQNPAALAAICSKMRISEVAA